MLAACIVVLDWGSKKVIVKNFSYVANYGAAFGMLQHQQWLFVSVAVAVSLALLLYYIPKYHYPELGLLLGGATGNLIDRLAYGYVIDFINLKFWPSFNVADASNTISILLLIWRLEIKPRMRKVYKERKRLQKGKDGTKSQR